MRGWVLALGLLLAGCGPGAGLEQWDNASYRRGRYNFDFWRRHREAYRTGAALHFAHSKQHDVLLLTPLAEAYWHDRQFSAEAVAWLLDPPDTEPHMAYWAPHTAQAFWDVFRAIDWTHVHHGMTYDVMSSHQVDWDGKAELTAKTVRAYLDRDPLARSPAPLDVTMRRANVMMKPYFGAWREKYPLSTEFFYVAHWWHPTIYEAIMIAGNDEEQDLSVQQVVGLTLQALEDRPQRMLLSREIMPRYSRMSPESANVFDNLHMLHGIVYDLLAYEDWTFAQKEAEIERVLIAMAHQAGDEALARTFTLPHPEMDPRRYEAWMTAPGGAMGEIMQEMLAEMWPMMSPDGSTDVPDAARRQLTLKMIPGLQEGEVSGSLHHALMQVVPGMRMDEDSMRPGGTSQRMVETMLTGWAEKHANEHVMPLPMAVDPTLPPLDRRPERSVVWSGGDQ